MKIICKNNLSRNQVFYFKPDWLCLSGLYFFDGWLNLISILQNLQFFLPLQKNKKLPLWLPYCYLIHFLSLNTDNNDKNITNTPYHTKYSDRLSDQWGQLD